MQTVELVCHAHRPNARAARDYLRQKLAENQVVVREYDTDTDTVSGPANGATELVISLGGDGTMLGAAARARTLGVPLIGINIGHLGFLTEVESDGMEAAIDAIVAGDLVIEKRMILTVTAQLPDGTTYRDWALNEVAIVRTEVKHPAHIGFGVDGHGVSTYGADGLILATPTGSTAYSFSAGGPVVWPDVEAVVVAPLAAHGLFTRPLVVSPKSELSVSVMRGQIAPLDLVCDGIRCRTLPPGSELSVTSANECLQLAHVSSTPFSARLVAKFNLPVKGWRDRRAE